MPKKILLADKSDAIRNIAESLLIQNGYDVIVASSVEKAKELIVTSQPNMVVVGADLKDSSGDYLYDALEDNPMTASIPILLIADPDGRSLPFPDEVILPRPFDPKEFLEKVRLFVGGGLEKKPDEKVTSVDPFSSGTIDDNFLDAALGIENIDVESSTVMDKSWMTGKVKIPQDKQDKTNGFGILQHTEDPSHNNESNKVESLMIREDGTPRPTQPPDKKTKGQSGASKIEIASDQYGLIDPDKPQETDIKPSEHDYNWFVKEMQKDSSAPAGPIASSPHKSDIKINKTSDSLEQVQAKPPERISVTQDKETEKPEIKEGGVSQFVADFKKEMDIIGTAPTPTDGTSATEAELAGQDKSAISDAEIRHFTNYLAELLAERLAKNIVEKIKPDEIYRLVREDFVRIISEKK